MIDKENRKVPKRVLETLKQVRDSGVINMFDKHGVIYETKKIDNWSGFWMYRFCYGICKKANTNYSIVLDQFSEYLRTKHD